MILTTQPNRSTIHSLTLRRRNRKLPRQQPIKQHRPTSRRFNPSIMKRIHNSTSKQHRVHREISLRNITISRHRPTQVNNNSLIRHKGNTNILFSHRRVTHTLNRRPTNRSTKTKTSLSRITLHRITHHPHSTNNRIRIRRRILTRLLFHTRIITHSRLTRQKRTISNNRTPSTKNVLPPPHRNHNLPH